MSAYVYRGMGQDTRTPPELQAVLDLDPELPDAPVWPHGTYTGFGRHRDAGEPQCEPCREAGNAYKRAHRRAAS